MEMLIAALPYLFGGFITTIPVLMLGMEDNLFEDHKTLKVTLIVVINIITWPVFTLTMVFVSVLRHIWRA